MIPVSSFLLLSCAPLQEVLMIKHLSEIVICLTIILANLLAYILGGAPLTVMIDYGWSVSRGGKSDLSFRR
jgi:hypothetical protein